MTTYQPVYRGVAAMFARDVLQKAAQIALARAASRPRPTGPPFDPHALLPVDSKTTKLGTKSKMSFVTQGHSVILENERMLPKGSVVIYAEDIRLAIRDLGLEHHVRREEPQKVAAKETTT